VKKLVIIALLISSVSVFKAQDIHFSMYNLSPLSLNPANTGNYNGDWRVMGNYRSQWREISKAYNTYSFGGDMNFYPFNQNVAGGLYILEDKSGGNLKVTKIYGSAALHKKIFGFKLSAGIQPGVVIKTLNINSHTFPNQLNWNTGSFDNSLPNNETFVSERSVYFDLNSGAIIQRRFGKIEPQVGFSLFHMNVPKETFYGAQNRLDMRKIAFANVRYFVNNKFAVVPNTVVNFTTKANDWIFGANVEYTLSRNAYFENQVFGGFVWRDGVQRISDAAVFNVGVKYNHYTIGMSYDVNVSRLKTATSYKGAFEIALIYTAKNTRLIKKQIPCDRY
jgi:type IX secretion system PorP/SprF family membrane protein